MSKTVDERVVEMRFDNQQFERNVQTSMSTLDKLKQSLKLTEASKGLQDVDSAAKRVDMSGLGNAVESVKARFSALQVMGVTALANITNSAVNAGKQMLSALTVEPIKAGFQEYETQMNAVQTILANTQKEGTNVKVVNKALDELNTYADKTIYNFTEMTRNIGTFTAAGVKLDTSVSAIKGIANLAAVSGSTSQQASTAMYQLSQAIASGTVKLQDWNSVVNAGMGGQVFQDALIRTAEHLGTGAKAAIKAQGSFRESLKDGWLTTEVLTQTLDQFSTAADTQKEYEAAVAKFVKQGYSKEEAKQMADMAKTAGEAATKVKTFTQLIDTLKEALGSGWTTSWRILIGDFEEAKNLWTDVSDYFSEAINKSSEARNKLLQGWADGGGRTMAIEGIKNSFDGLLSVIKPIKEAFREVFPPTTAKQLLSITEKFKNLTEKFKIGSETADKLKRTFKGVFSILDLGKKAITALIKPFATLAGSKGISSFADLLLSITASIGDFFTALNEGAGAGKFFSTISGTLSKTFGGISKIFESATKGIRGFGDIFSKVCSGIAKFAGKIGNGLKVAFSWLTENVSIKDVFAGLIGSGAFVSIKKFSSLIDKIKDALENLFGKKDGGGSGLSEIKEKFSDILSSVKESIQSFTAGIKIGSLLMIAVAIGILSASLKTIAKLKFADVSKGLFAIGVMLTMLSASFKALIKSLDKFNSKGIVKSAFSLVLIAAAIKILASAMAQIGKLSMGEIAKGLLGLGGALLELAIAAKIMNAVKIPVSTAVTLLALAVSCRLIAKSLADFGSMSWGQIGRGLVAMGGALLELAGIAILLGYFTGPGAILGAAAVLVLSLSLRKIAAGLKDFGSMSWDEIKRGLVAMGGALLELKVALGNAGIIAGFGKVLTATAFVIITACLDTLADALQKFGSMSWDEIKHGLVAMGGALLELKVALGNAGIIAGFGKVLTATAFVTITSCLSDLADALESFGSMSWDEIKRGLVAMGGALLELKVTLNNAGIISGFGKILTASSFVIITSCLSDLADALQKFGSMSWDEITRGLVAMGGALLELKVALGNAGIIAGIGKNLSAASFVILTSCLDDLSQAMVKFGSMSWDEIKRGLVAMGGALLELKVAIGSSGILSSIAKEMSANSFSSLIDSLDGLVEAFERFASLSWDEVKSGLAAMGGALGELALGGFLNTLSGIGASAIAEVAAPLGTLADSVKKWSNVTVPEGLGEQLGTLASGIRKFTFDGMGASALSECAAPLGTLADSVTKWSNVTVPEGLGEQLGTLASGIRKFTFDGMGAKTIAECASPLGQLADSIRKWSDVTVPDGIGDNLATLAAGIKAFSFAFMGGWSLSTITGPLGDLVDDIKKWKDVTIPVTLSDNLTSLASGIKSLSFAFMGGWSLAAITGPLGDLAGSIKKWTDVTVPAGFKDNLKNIADGIKEFGLLDVAKLSIIDGPLSTLGTALKNIGSISGTGENLVTFANNIKSCIGNLTGLDISAANTASSTIATLVKVIKDVNGTSVGNVAAFVTAANSLNNIKIGKINVDTNGIASAVSAIKNAMNSMSTEISSKKSSLESAMKTAVSGLGKAATSKKNDVNSAGKALGKAVADGIKDKESSVKSAGKTLASKGSDGVKDKKSSFNSAGKNLGEGLVEGINSKQQAAYDAGYALGQKAVQGEKDGQKSKSPSKLTIKAGKWLGEGLIIGMRKMSNLVYRSGYDLGETAVNSMSSTISRIADIFNSDIDAQPTIRPVVDLSNIESGARSIGEMLNVDPSVGMMANIGSINSMMRRRQNGSNDDVVTAIKDLGRKISNRSGDTYNFGDFTYSDGSEVSDAIKTLVRAARMERRT